MSCYDHINYCCCFLYHSFSCYYHKFWPSFIHLFEQSVAHQDCCPCWRYLKFLSDFVLAIFFEHWSWCNSFWGFPKSKTFWFCFSQKWAFRRDLLSFRIPFQDSCAFVHCKVPLIDCYYYRICIHLCFSGHCIYSCDLEVDFTISLEIKEGLLLNDTSFIYNLIRNWKLFSFDYYIHSWSTRFILWQAFKV